MISLQTENEAKNLLKCAGKDRALSFSFEFFPPRDDLMTQKLAVTAKNLATLDPSFFSVTYGAGGSTRDRSLATIRQLRKLGCGHVVGHLTCVAAGKKEADEVAAAYDEAGVTRLVLLRGDPPAGIDTVYAGHEDGYETTADFITGVRKIAPFEIIVGCYPEGHPQSDDIEGDIEILRAKVAAGATQAITQFFFDSEDYFYFVERVRAAGITVPIIPGIMPVVNFRSVQRMAKACGAKIPPKMREVFQAAAAEDDASRQSTAARFAYAQCRDLWDAGVRDFHFYTLNRSMPVLTVCRLLRAQEVSTKAGLAI